MKLGKLLELGSQGDLGLDLLVGVCGLLHTRLSRGWQGVALPLLP